MINSLTVLYFHINQKNNVKNIIYADILTSFYIFTKYKNIDKQGKIEMK